jgi:SAM-dependent methyltransferase
LEHVFNPDDFLGEINRVLKPGGKLLLTVPFVWDEHEQPYDYARYSSFGLKSLIEKNGFTQLKHVKSAKNYSVISQLTIAYFFKIVYKKRVIKMFFTLFVFPFITIGGLLLGKILPDNNDLFLDNIILAEKVCDV